MLPSVLGKVSRCHCLPGSVPAQQGLPVGADAAGQNLSGLLLGSMPVFCFHQSLRKFNVLDMDGRTRQPSRLRRGSNLHCTRNVGDSEAWSAWGQIIWGNRIIAVVTLAVQGSSPDAVLSTFICLPLFKRYADPVK